MQVKGRQMYFLQVLLKKQARDEIEAFRQAFLYIAKKFTASREHSPWTIYWTPSTKMSDPKIPELYPRSTPSWQAKQREAFWSVNEGKTQPFNTRPDELEKLARECLSRNGRLYAESVRTFAHYYRSV